MMLQKRLDKTEIKLGEPIPWSIYSKDGVQYFKQGFIFRTPKSLSRLEGVDLYRDAVETVVDIDQLLNVAGTVELEAPHPARATPLDADEAGNVQSMLFEGERLSVFKELEVLSQRLDVARQQIKHHYKPAVNDIYAIAARIKMLYEHAPDICLAAVNLYRPGNIKKFKPLFTVLLCLMQSSENELDERSEEALIYAVLTADIIDPKVYFMGADVNELDREALRKERIQTVVLLGEVGVDSALCFEIILQSTEMSEHTLIESAIFRVAETYLYALLFGFMGRPSTPKEALKKVFQDSPSDNQTVYVRFIKQLGIYPPGTIVRLDNGEIGIVMRRDKVNTLHAEVFSLYMSSKKEFPIPILRKTTQQGFGVKEILRLGEIIVEDPEHLWDGLKS